MTSRTFSLSQAINHALSSYNAGEFTEAEKICQQIISAKHDFFDALHLLAVVQSRLGKKDTALVSYNRALTVRPDHAQALSNRGVTLHELKRFNEALASYDQALTVQPDHAEALSNRGVTLHELKRFDEALASCDRALTVRPDHADALSNRGNALKELKRLDEALASYDRALAMRPDHADALSNRGLALHELKRFDEALASYDRALTVRPDYADAHCNVASTRLLTGDFDRDWPEHEWRWKNDSFTSTRRNLAQPLWLGVDAIDGKTILLHSEQGFGDTIQFCRYVPLVAARGARVILEVENPLLELMSNFLCVRQVVSKGEPLPDFDVHCPLLTLPLVFATRLETIPADVPYLSATATFSEKWKRRLPKSATARIGISWAGNPNYKYDQSRSIGLSPMLPLLSCQDVQFFSIQKDLRVGDLETLRNNPHVKHLGEEIETFEDTAAIISLLDLVISSDTSIVHLAGALGKPVWVLLQHVPDWRWLLDRDDSPWYPTARLFRQDDTRAWDSVIARVHKALLKLVESRRQ
jgi:tetratricopeptide (TPR) repeat protein